MRSKQQPRPSFRWPQQRGDNVTGKYHEKKKIKSSVVTITRKYRNVVARYAKAIGVLYSFECRTEISFWSNRATYVELTSACLTGWRLSSANPMYSTLYIVRSYIASVTYPPLIHDARLAYVPHCLMFYQWHFGHVRVFLWFQRTDTMYTRENY